MKICAVCGSDKVIARGLCKKHYDEWYRDNKNSSDIRKQKPRKSRKQKDTRQFPIPSIVTVWECSDGREFSSETEALRYELELFRKG